MAKEIWLGPVAGNNRERLLARCAAYISRGQTDRLLYIAASHPLLELVTEKLLDGKTARGVWGEFPVYLFRGLVKRILSSAVASETNLMQVLPPCVPIDREELPLRQSLISQIIKQLNAQGKLKALRPLANRDGCVNTIASLIGEIQRAGRTPEEFHAAIEARAGEMAPGTSGDKSIRHGQARAQVDFDREVALLYSAYSDILERSGLTDEDHDQLMALQVLSGELKNVNVSLPWLKQVDLLVLDGFFDFTPVQGEMLRRLIPAIPNVIVNLNYDRKNEEIFQPFKSTIDQLKSIAEFETSYHDTLTTTPEHLAVRERLFNSAQPASATGEAKEPDEANEATFHLFECSDRETEIRSIAKEIKRLVLTQSYRLADIALVVRQRSAYAGTILRVFADENIPCNLERRAEAKEISCVRACAKLFDILREPARAHVTNPKTSDIAHLVKAGYFRLATGDLAALTEVFDSRYASLLKTASRPSANPNDDEQVERLRGRLGIGRWMPDVLENIFAYVGSDLRVDAWLSRAQRIIDALPSAEAARSFISGKEGTEGDDAAAVAEREPPESAAEKSSLKAPSVVHPAAIAWTIIVMEKLRSLIAAVPGDGSPEDLRTAVMSLFEQLEFSKQVTLPLLQSSATVDIPSATLNVRGLESLRRAMAAAVRSFNYVMPVVSTSRASSRESQTSLTGELQTQASLAAFIEEVERCLHSQVLTAGGGNRDGLRVLEATDVRGLRFRAMFVAGMIEGGFPLRISGDWLYPQEERDRLQRYGVTLEDISNETLLKEEHYFYQAACRAGDRLYLSRPIALDDGSETVPSYYIQELKRAIAPASLSTVAIRSDIDRQDLSDCSTAAELATVLVRQSEQQHEQTASVSQTVAEGLLKQTDARAFLSNSALRRIAVEKERTGPWFGPFDGEISAPELRAMLARHFGPEYVYSASSLSTYGKCSYRFFAARLLKLEPRNEAALDLPAIDAGKLLHEILRRFFERHRTEFLPALDRDELRSEIARVADLVFREHERLVPALNERIWKIDCEIRKLILDQVLLFELRLQERADAQGMRPAFFELAFGRNSAGSDPSSRSDYLVFKRPRSETAESVLIQGQIDRVDLNHERKIAIAYDYKLSQGAKPADIETAREVQIPVYLAALEEMFVPGYQLAGGGYYRLRARGPRLNQGLYRRMFEDCTSVTGKMMCTDEEWNRIREAVRRRIWSFIDGMRSGDFRVRPSLGKQTCKFCDFAAVCRYDTYRISRKRVSPL